MFKKSLPLALVAIAGCVALSPNAQKPDNTTQSASPTPTAQTASPTPVPTPTPTSSPTPKPTPLPDNILKINFHPVEGVPGLEEVGSYGAYLGKRYVAHDYLGIVNSASRDMYIQTGIPSDSISILCPNCEKTDGALKYNNHYAIYKQAKNENEFEFVAMAGKKTFSGSPVIVYYYSRRDFTFSKLAEVASVSMASWVVKSVDIAKKEIVFDATVWPKNTGSLALSDIGSEEFFGWDLDAADRESCRTSPTAECALTFVRERTAFTGSVTYFIGGGRISGGYYNASASTTIFRVGETGTEEIVGKNIAAYFAKSSNSRAVHNFVYSHADGKFYVVAHTQGGMWALYRVNEDVLVP